MILAGLRAILEANDCVISGEASSGRDLVSKVAASGCSVLLLDIRMDDVDGVTALHALQKAGSPVPVIILTGGAPEATLAECLESGARGIVFKHEAPTSLLECLEHVAAGRPWVPETLRATLEPYRQKIRDASSRPLSPREKEIVGHVAHGLKNRDIAAAMGITEGTVKVYLHTIFEKMGVANRTELAMRGSAIH